MNFENEKVWFNDCERAAALRKAGMTNLTESSYFAKRRSRVKPQKNITFKWNLGMTIATISMFLFYMYA